MLAVAMAAFTPAARPALSQIETASTAHQHMQVRHIALLVLAIIPIVILLGMLLLYVVQFMVKCIALMGNRARGRDQQYQQVADRASAAAGVAGAADAAAIDVQGPHVITVTSWRRLFAQQPREPQEIVLEAERGEDGTMRLPLLAAEGQQAFVGVVPGAVESRWQPLAEEPAGEALHVAAALASQQQALHVQRIAAWLHVLEETCFTLRGNKLMS